jgi:hypothetical protein
MKRYVICAPDLHSAASGLAAMAQTAVTFGDGISLAEGATRKISAKTLKVAPSTLSVALKRYAAGPHSECAAVNKRPPPDAIPPRSLNRPG